MAQGQVSISTRGKMADIVAEARSTFPDAQTDGQALTRALFHWYHGREQNSKRGALERVETTVAEILRLIKEQEDVRETLHRGRNHDVAK